LAVHQALLRAGDYGAVMDDTAPRRSRWLLLLCCHVLAALLAIVGGVGSIWVMLENLGWGRESELTVVALASATALAGVISVVLPLGSLLVPDRTAWWERLLALMAGSVIGGIGAGVVLLSAAVTFGIVAVPVGLLVGGAALVLFLLFLIAALVVRATSRDTRWPVLLVAAGSQVAVAQFVPWWVLGTVLMGGEIL